MAGYAAILKKYNRAQAMAVLYEKFLLNCPAAERRSLKKLRKKHLKIAESAKASLKAKERRYHDRTKFLEVKKCLC